MTDIFQLTMPTVPTLLRAETKIGQSPSIEHTLDIIFDMKGSAPASDLILAALHHIAYLRNDEVLTEVVNELDAIF